MSVYVLYHDNCLDGLGAKFAAWWKFDKDAQYIAVNYNNPFPNIPLNKEETEIYILDFSYPKEILEDLKTQVKKIQVLDHHKSAQEQLEGLSYAHFDMDQSGAVLAWRYFHPEYEVPHILNLIQDRDLWKKQYPESEAFVTFLYNSPWREDMDYWAVLASSKKHLQAGCETGQNYLTYRNNWIKDQVSKRGTNWTLREYNGLRMALINSNFAISNLCEGLYNHPTLNIDFACSYMLTGKGKLLLSFRSGKGEQGVDVSKIAALYGGGGHHNAAGANLPKEKAFQVLSDFFDLKIIEN